MLFDVLTGVFSALFIALSLFYLFRRKVKGKINRLKFHCISGSILVIAALIHINFKILNPSFSLGWITFIALISVAVTGFLKRRFMKSKFCYYAHTSCACVFLLSFVVHAIQQIINLLVM